MTYRELLNLLSRSLSDEQLDQYATVHLDYTDEFVPVTNGLSITTEDDVLGKGYVYLTIDF